VLLETRLVPGLIEDCSLCNVARADPVVEGDQREDRKGKQSASSIGWPFCTDERAGHVLERAARES
jgi:hypothetical protein